MHRLKIRSLLVLSAICYGAILAEAQTPTDDKSLGDVARELRNQRVATGPAQTGVTSAPQTASPAVVTDSPEVERFMHEANALLMRERFVELDKMADEVRSSKARFPGGGWKLSRFYEALGRMNAGENATETDWQSHLAVFQRWMAARPQSITARVALAEAYLDYAWAARGNGYANTVTGNGWRLFEERSQQAAKVLIEAAALPAKCPYWTELMQQVALAAGADKNQHMAIFEKAIKFEPLYFAYYQRYAQALLLKWKGEPGDIKAFAEETYRRVGGKEGAHIYFEIASNLCGRCGDFSTDDFSWPRLKEGFSALEELYGLTPLKLNRFAFMAAAYGDQQAAARAFLRIGPYWDYSVWGSRARFESQRTWAGLPASPQPAWPAVSQQPDVGPPPTARVAEMLQAAGRATSQGRWSESTELAQQLINTANSLPGTATEIGRAYLIIANNEYRQGRISEAQTMVDRAVSAVAAKAGANSIELASTLDRASMFAQVMNDNARAEADLRRAIEIREKINGTADPGLSNELTMLGNVCRARGQTKEAFELYQRAITTREAVRPDDLALISPLEQLGLLYQDESRYQEAEGTFLRLLNLMEARFGLDSPQLTSPLSKLASLYHVMGKTASEENARARLQMIQNAQPK